MFPRKNQKLEAINIQREFNPEQLNQSKLDEFENSQIFDYEECESYQGFEENYNVLFKTIKQIIKSEEFRLNQSEQFFEQLCKETIQLIIQWDSQPKDIQNIFYREPLLRGIMSILSVPNNQIKLKIIMASLFILDKLKWQNCFSIYFGNTHNLININSSNLSLNADGFLQSLNIILKEAFNMSKMPENDFLFIQHGLIKQMLHILKNFMLLGKEWLIELLQQYQKASQCNQKELKELPNNQKDSFFEQIIFLLKKVFGILKNSSGNTSIRQQILINKNIERIIFFLHLFDYKLFFQNHCAYKLITELYVEITCLLRNLVIEQKCLTQFINFGVISKLSQSLEFYSSHDQLTQNTLRIFSKISLDRSCGAIMLQNRQSINNMLSLFKTQKENQYIILRVSFILSNITSYFEKIREIIFFEQNCFEDICECFYYYFQQTANPAHIIQDENKFNISMASWDMKQLQKETAADTLIKIIKLITNLLTIFEIGDKVKNSEAYITILTKSQLLLSQNLTKNNLELRQCTLSLLSNLTYYENEKVVGADYYEQQIKNQILKLLNPFIMQLKDQEVCCEALRVMANLSRNKDRQKIILQSNAIQGIIMLLEQSNQDIVYYSLGILFNLQQNNEFINKYLEQLVLSLNNILNECSIEQFDILMLAFSLFSKLLTQNKQNIFDKQLLTSNKVKDQLIDLQNLCKNFLKSCQIQEELIEINHLYDSISEAINQLQQSVNEFTCSYDCGRKFNSQQELDHHLERRHQRKNNL